MAICHFGIIITEDFFKLFLVTDFKLPDERLEIVFRFLAGLFRCGRLAAGFFFEGLRFCAMGRFRFSLSAPNTTAPMAALLGHFRT